MIIIFNNLRRLGLRLRLDNIALEEELAEEVQVAGVHEQCSSNVESTCVTTLLLGVSVGSHTDADTHHHLKDLSNSDNLRVKPFWFALDCHKEIVEIHYTVHRIVHHSKNKS